MITLINTDTIVIAFSVKYVYIRMIIQNLSSSKILFVEEANTVGKQIR